MARLSLYLETTVISYYTAKPSRDLLVAAHQELTLEWWNRYLPQYDPVVSAPVIDEIMAGDPLAAEKRLNAVRNFGVLKAVPEIEELAGKYMRILGLPGRARLDAVHLAYASIHGVPQLVTWNCAHIANPETIMKVMRLNDQRGIETPVIRTPELFFQED